MSDKNVLVTPPFASTLFETCTYSVTPAALNVGASSQSGTIAVTAETGCYWNVRESSSWLSPFTFGSGTGTLNYFISFNPGEARSGSISVGRVVIPVNQSSNCTFALSPASPQSVASTGGSLSVNVTTGSTCTWTAVSSVPWITVTSGSSGSGNGTASLQIAANVGAARSGSVTIAGQDYVINQAASSSCNYSLSPSSTTISESGGAGNFGVTSNDGCTWSATSNALWITTSSTGSGNGTVTFTVAANSGNARSGSILVAGQAFTVNQSAASSGPIVPVKVSSADSALSDFFGNSVSINGNTAIVGANGHAVGGNDDQGAAYVYVRNGTSWVLQQKLTMPTADAQVAAQFGYSVAISGDTVIVGSPTQDNGGNIDQGAAYVYVRSGTTWTFQQRLRQSDGAAGDNFGWSVAIDGNTAVVGAYLDDESVYTNCGSAYAYLRTGSTWAEESRMVSSERTSNSQMGYSVGISGDTVIIGARLAQSSTSSPDFGSAYIFTPVAGTPRIWTQRSILTAPQRGAGDQFGFSVGVNGNTALIGARFDDVGSNVDQGSAYVFTGSGNTWSFQRQLLANDGIANDEFGNAVSISGDKLIIGAPQNSSRNGKAYLFTGIGANWSQLPVVVAPDGSLNDLYGSSVAINGSNAVVGAVFDDARRGSVYFLSGIPSAKSKLTADFDGDGKTDLSVFRPANGQWWLGRSTDGLIVHTFGNSSDILTPGDFTGDGKSDVSIFRPSSGEWFVLRSEDSSFYSFPFGTNGDVPVPADYDGDGKTDAAVFRSSNSTWYIQRSSGGTTIQGFGVSGDRPVPADYDGDGKADIAVFRPSLGQWWLNRSTAGGIAVTFGSATDRTVQGDYTGDGKTDIAIWRPSNGEWFILRSEDFTFYSFPFGAGGDTPAPGDYDGDGKTDAAVFRPSNSTWYVQRSTAGTLIQGFGLPPDLPVPSAYVR
ncbi:MAG: VCBS repeat-containing protein [Acidobacteria bacterium]|nr:VCBS repeat-containing protein [Acidobacteriota bacterium]